MREPNSPPRDTEQRLAVLSHKGERDALHAKVKELQNEVLVLMEEAGERLSDFVDARATELIAEVECMRPVYEAAKALCNQPMLRKGDAATWGDVAQSNAEGPKLLGALMNAVDAALASEAKVST